MKDKAHHAEKQEQYLHIIIVKCPFGYQFRYSIGDNIAPCVVNYLTF